MRSGGSNPNPSAEEVAFLNRLGTLLLDVQSALSNSKRLRPQQLTFSSTDRLSSLKLPTVATNSDDFANLRNAIENELNNIPANYPWTAQRQSKHSEGVFNFDEQERERHLNFLKLCLHKLKNFSEKEENRPFIPQDNYDYDAMPNLDITVISSAKINYLRESVKNLSDYCASIHDDGKSKQIADDLTAQLQRINSRTYTVDFKDATDKMFKIYNDNIGYLETRRDNSLNHILVNVAIALSIIGFIAQIANKLTTGNMFFFFDPQTTRKNLAVKVDEALKNLNNK